MLQEKMIEDHFVLMSYVQCDTVWHPTENHHTIDQPPARNPIVKWILRCTIFAMDKYPNQISSLVYELNIFN